MISSAQKSDFQDRIARIAAGQGSSRATVFVGQDYSFSWQPRHRRRRGAGVQGALRNVGHALSFPLCMALGFLSHALERYSEWVFLGVPQAASNIDIDMARIALTGAVFSIVLTHLLGLRDRSLLVPKLLGVAAGMLFFHNLVHAWPAVFDQIFSPIWVARVTSMTEPASLWFREVSYPF
jgi:hypothetical protein